MADLDAALEVRRLRAQDLGDAGTIFHRTRTPLSTWFAAIWLVTSQKNGASAQNLHDMLGLGSYATAWAWLHKLRRAMVRPDRELLCGVVEVDEAFVGGRATAKQGASTDKVPVMIAVENTGTQVNRKLRLGRVRLGVADAPGSKQLVEFARTTVASGSLIRTDGARMFRVLAQEGYTHQYVSGYSSPEPGHVTLPGPHRNRSHTRQQLRRQHPPTPTPSTAARKRWACHRLAVTATARGVRSPRRGGDRTHCEFRPAQLPFSPEVQCAVSTSVTRV